VDPYVRFMKSLRYRSTKSTHFVYLLTLMASWVRTMCICTLAVASAVLVLTFWSCFYYWHTSIYNHEIRKVLCSNLYTLIIGFKTKRLARCLYCGGRGAYTDC